MALTDDYSFKLSDTGVILNPDLSTLPFVDILKISGLDSPEFRESMHDHEGQDGGFIDAEFEKGRNVDIEGRIYCDTFEMENFLDSLKANWAPRTSSVPLYFKVPGQVERLLLVKPLGVRYPWDISRRVGQIDVRFSAYAEDPRIYTSTLKNTIIDLGGVATDGLGFPIGFPFGFGTLPSDQATDVINSGNRPTPVVMTITGPANTPRIVNDTLGVTMIFNIALSTGETLVVDSQYKTIKLNGTTNRRSVLEEPNWFFLQSGDNFLRYRANTITSSTLTVTYRDAWR